MKLSKPSIKFITLAFGSWVFLNVALNMIGLFVNKLITGTQFVYLDNILLEFVKPIAIQSFVFLLCITLASVFMKNKVWTSFVFVILQTLVFHIIFFMHLRYNHGIQFASTIEGLDIQYLSNFGQYLIDVLNLYFPINGNFSNGMFVPTNLFVFYFYWIFLSIVYYVLLTWLMLKSLNFFFEIEVN